MPASFAPSTVHYWVTRTLESLHHSLSNFASSVNQADRRMQRAGMVTTRSEGLSLVPIESDQKSPSR